MSGSAILPHATRRSDYRPPAFLVDAVELRFDLDPASTTVRSRLTLRRNPAHGEAGSRLRLDGEALHLVSVHLDGGPLGANRFRRLPDGGLELDDLPDACVLELETTIVPDANTELSGLYLSSGSFVTQCEAEGFRRITFFPDRPDVLARYSTTITADRIAMPVLLANGNLVAFATDGRRHWATWDDPHPKPSYLFALVAGDFTAVRDRFTTRSGRVVDLAIRVRRGDEGATGHAMQALKAVMAWDEAQYGFEYDLDALMLVAVPDFNVGAQENKGLFVFNSRYLLARPDTATDADFQAIEALVAHEYLHNWTGNRITCRDWFQLALKEGLTVFREQQFVADQGSAAVRRIADIRRLRAVQFPADAGPRAQPVRPDSYAAVANLYTATTYRKGAEIVRMLHLVVGPSAFRRGMALFAARHDGQAVTIEHLLAALQDAAGTDLSAFLGWYAQAGTPEVSVADSYDEAARRYTLTLRQRTPPTADQPDKSPLPIPIAMALLAQDGRELAAGMLLLTQAEQRFTFEGISAAPVPSLLRGFSAPVRLAGLGQDQLRLLAARDPDPFVRWDSLQSYATAVMLDRIAARRPDGSDAGLHAALAALLAAAPGDPAYAAACLSLPAETTLADRMAVIDVDMIFAVREGLRGALGRALAPVLRETHAGMADPGAYRADGRSIARRSLRNACLAYLAAAGEEGLALATRQAAVSDNMTDTLAALYVLADSDAPGREAALAEFHARWRGNKLVLDKWFSLQALSSRADTIDVVRRLFGHPDFDLRNPDRARALLEGFAANQLRFHDAAGAGYQFLADAIAQLDPINSQTAARLVDPLGTWRRHEPLRAGHMRAELERLLAMPGLSRGTSERVSRALG